MKRTMKNRVGEAPASASAGACLAAFSSLTDWPVGRSAGRCRRQCPAGNRLFYYSKNAHRAGAFKLLGGNYFVSPRRRRRRRHGTARPPARPVWVRRRRLHSYVPSRARPGLARRRRRPGRGAKSRRRDGAYGRPSSWTAAARSSKRPCLLPSTGNNGLRSAPGRYRVFVVRCRALFVILFVPQVMKGRTTRHTPPLSFTI